LISKLWGWIFAALGGLSAFLGLSGVATEMLRNWLTGQGYIEHPENGVFWFIAAIAVLAQYSWFFPVCLGLIVLPMLFWIVSILQRHRKRRRSDLEALGRDMLRTAVFIRGRQGGFRNEWPGNIADQRGKLDAVLTLARSYGLYSPDDKVFVHANGFNILFEYLDFVGAHLKEGNFKAARTRAAQTKVKLE
jgi:hypothetical protein